MVEIRKATTKDIELIIHLGRTTFIEAHENSATKEELATYLNGVYNPVAFKKELEDPSNIFHLIYYNNVAAGFSKIRLNVLDPNIPLKNATKLDRIYILKEFYDKKLGLELFTFNMNLSKKLTQKGMWLYVWVENHRAISFYKKIGFEAVAVYYFKLSETKSNPNHQMLLVY